MKQKSMRDYGKVDPDRERSLSRAGENNSELVTEDGFRNPALFKKDPYPSGQEVDPPNWADRSGDRLWPDDIKKDYSKDEEA